MQPLVCWTSSPALPQRAPHASHWTDSTRWVGPEVPDLALAVMCMDSRGAGPRTDFCVVCVGGCACVDTVIALGDEQSTES
jgi:hypothetical protein